MKICNLVTRLALRCLPCIHTYIRLLTTSSKGLFSVNYKEEEKEKIRKHIQIIELQIANYLRYHSSLLNLSKSAPLSLFLKLLTSMHNLTLLLNYSRCSLSYSGKFSAQWQT